MDTAARDRLVQEETNRFLDTQFGGLDLSGSPNFTKPLTETFAPEDRHGFNRIDCSGLGGINKLRELVQEPDREALTAVARFTDLEDAVQALMSAGRWTVVDLEAAYKTLLNAGQLEVPTNEPRNLTESERLECALMAANGDVLGAVARYLQCRVSEEVAHDIEFELIDPVRFTANPEYRPLLEEAILFAWQEWRKDFSPTEERLRFLKQYVAGRYLTNALLDAAWEACKIAEKDATRSALFCTSSKNEGQEEADLDSMTDDEIARLKTATLREHARKVRQQSRRL